MEKFKMPNTDLIVSKMGLGCMRIASKSDEELDELIRTALDEGINFFDHADIYGHSQCEKKFGDVLKRHPEWRQEMVIQTKCDIVPKYEGGQRYDTSREHILDAVHKSLEKLQCGYIDILLLHRPDALMDPVETAQTFKELKDEGLVHYFGVSNHSAGAIARLQKELDFPLVVNQMQLSIVHSYLLDAGFGINMAEPQSLLHDDGVLNWCLAHDMTVQTWCPLQASWEDGTFIGNPKYPKLNEILENLAEKYHVTRAAIALAWILRIPGAVMPIIGTTSPGHLKESIAALDVHLSRQEWYDLYAAQGKLLP